MSLHNSRVRGASLVEYALLLFLFIGGAAAAVKTTGIAARDVFERGAGGELSVQSKQAGLRPPNVDRRDGGQ
jgi:hypothetical protein